MSATEPVRFAYWVPDVSGGPVTSTIEQRTDRGDDYNRELAVLAENNGFDHALTQVRSMAGYGAAVKQAGASTADGKGMWQDSGFEGLVQYNDGFRTGLIGTPERIAERIVAYKRLGVDLFLLGFLHHQEEVEYFGRRVPPLVREPEARLPDRETEPAAVPA
ncbi:hypothetical protein ACICHK_35775 [Streptomyces sp. AHU1]|uniref:hypothetical protein n=1 Tax=Streptomyces sp. AHU1 TaxID=3377215 RepID=UPI003877AB0B